MSKAAKLIGLTGTNGAGKGEAAAFFKKNGFAYFSLSDIIRAEIKKRGQKETRNILIKTGNQLRKKFGPDILARLAMKKVEGRAIIDSIRNPQEVEYLRSQKNFLLLAIDAPVEIRYERAKNRGRNESARTLEEFIRKEEEEMSSQERGQQLHICMKMADATLINDRTLEEFHRKLERFL